MNKLEDKYIYTWMPFKSLNMLLLLQKDTSQLTGHMLVNS